MKSNTRTLLLLLFLFLKTPLFSEELPTLPLIELVIRSEYTAVAQLAGYLDKKAPGDLTFDILEWVKKPKGMTQSRLNVQFGQLYDFINICEEKDQQMVCNVQQFLLFFNKEMGYNDDSIFSLVISGVRVLTKDGNILVPFQPENPGNYHLAKYKKDWADVDSPTAWNTLLSDVRAMTQRTNEVFSLRKIAVAPQRNKAIFEWIDRHSSELVSGTGYWEGPWGSLKEEVFKWIWSSGLYEDAWEASLLWQQLDTAYHRMGIVLEDGARSPFGTPEARAFLFEKMTAPNAGLTDIRLALIHLKDNFWYNPYFREEELPLRPITLKEQDRLAEKFMALAHHKDPMVRELALTALATLADPPEVSFKIFYRNDRILEALAAAFPKLPPGHFRNDMAERLAGVMSAREWERMTGNPDGILMLIRYGSYDPKKKVVSLYLFRPSGREHIRRQPTIVTQRLGKDGRILEEKTFPATPTDPSYSWEATNYYQSSTVIVELPTGTLTEGKWRFQAKGTVGDGSGREWLSEVLEMEVGKE